MFSSKFYMEKYVKITNDQIIFYSAESNETYTECSRLQINDMCQTILEENVYWLSNEHRKTRKSR